MESNPDVPVAAQLVSKGTTHALPESYMAACQLFRCKAVVQMRMLGAETGSRTFPYNVFKSIKRRSACWWKLPHVELARLEAVTHQH